MNKDVIYKKIRRMNTKNKDEYQKNESNMKKQALKNMFTHAFVKRGSTGGSFPQKGKLAQKTKKGGGKSAPARLNTVHHASNPFYHTRYRSQKRSRGSSP